MSMPLLTVVIPTARRPQLLPRAVTSALEAAPQGSVEVIVVPNGPDTSWRGVAAQFGADPRVRWLPIATPHANAARNHGMAQATGTYIRFLDDDDYLYPEACVEQCRRLDAGQADVCSGAVDVVGDDGALLKVLRQPGVADFASAALGPSRLTATCAHVFRRSVVAGQPWDEKQDVRQDTAWVMQVAAAQEMKWIRLEVPVGAWVQHRGARISRGRDPGARVLRETAEMIVAAARRLERDHRLTDERRVAVADALWGCLQKGLRYDRAYWRRVAGLADAYAPGRTPPSRLYRYRLARWLHPWWVETLLVPLRWLYHPVRRVLESFGVGRV